MKPEEAAIRKTILLDQLCGEDEISLRVVRAIPADKLGWKPVADKAMTAGELAFHLAGSGMFFVDVVAGRNPANPPAAPATHAELLGAVEGVQKAFRAAVEALSPEECAKEVDFFGMKLSAIELLSWHVLHLVHHRGQLATYLRVMGARVPNIYGGSADEPMGG